MLRHTLERWFHAPPTAPEGSSSGPLAGPPTGYTLEDRLPEIRGPFAKLHRAFQSGQWSADDGSVDWSAAPIVEDLVVYRREALELRAHFIADFFAGEQFSLRGAGRRLDALDRLDEKLCYALMIVDEHRHTEVFGRYQQKLGVVRAADPRLVETLEWAETLDVEAFQLGSLILETIAVHAMPSMWRSTRDPLLRAMLPLVHRDEARHEALSHLYLCSRAARWTAARRATLAALGAEMYRRQRRYMCERNPILPFRIPRPIGIALDLVAGRALRSGTRVLVDRFRAMGLVPSDEMAAVVR